MYLRIALAFRILGRTGRCDYRCIHDRSALEHQPLFGFLDGSKAPSLALDRSSKPLVTQSLPWPLAMICTEKRRNGRSDRDRPLHPSPRYVRFRQGPVTRTDHTAHNGPSRDEQRLVDVHAGFFLRRRVFVQVPCEHSETQMLLAGACCHRHLTGTVHEEFYAPYVICDSPQWRPFPGSRTQTRPL